MKKTYALMAALAIVTISCQETPSADTANTGNAVDVANASGATYKIDSNSLVNWSATKPDAVHTGTFKVKDGSISVENELITGGSFTIDITSLSNSDLEGEWKEKLEGHLKSADFFDVQQFPTAEFVITSVSTFDSAKDKSLLAEATHIINGNLTLKDSTKNISFPVSVKNSGNNFMVKADFNIDRTLWGMNYKGPNNPADWFIRKEVNLKFDITAVR
jgi:polyisoprenoid-binding protein YceI